MIGLSRTDGKGGKPSESSAHEEPPSPPGVEKEHVDPYTLQVIDQLFPRHHGLEFLAGILRLAVAKQLALPELEIHQVADVAVITVQNMRTLARLIGMSYDTTEKYIVILSHLRLLYKQRQRNQIVLHFPLCRCQLPEPEVLDQIQEMRPANPIPRYRGKVRSFANQVKRRFLLLRKKGHLVTPLPVSQVPPTDQLQETLIDDIRHILQQEVDSETESRLLLKIEGAVRYRCSKSISRLSHTIGDSDEEENIVEGTLQEKESPVSRTIVDSEGEAADQQSRLSHTVGDSFSHGTPLKGRLKTQKGDSETRVSRQKSPIPDQKVDSDQHQMVQNGRLSASIQHAEHETGDSEAREKAFNVNVITILNKINVNVGEVATYLCHLFNENPEGKDNKKGYYKNLYDKQGCRNVQMWLAALVETAQSTLRRKPDKKGNPGGYFYSRCIHLHQHGIPSRTLQLVQRVQQEETFTYQQLLDLLRQGPATGSTPLLSQTQDNRPRPPSYRIKLTIPYPPENQRGMPRDIYQQMVQQVKDGANTKHMRYASYQQGDDSWIVLVEDWFGDQRWVSSLKEWQEYASQIRGSTWPKERSSK